MLTTLTHDGLADVTHGNCPACGAVCADLTWHEGVGRLCSGCAPRGTIVGRRAGDRAVRIFAL